MEWKQKIEQWQDRINAWLKSVRLWLFDRFMVARAVVRAGIPIRFALFFLLLGILLGLGVKSYATRHITIGAEDYRLKSIIGTPLDLNQVQANLLARSENPDQIEAKKTYPACSLNDY